MICGYSAMASIRMKRWIPGQARNDKNFDSMLQIGDFFKFLKNQGHFQRSQKVVFFWTRGLNLLSTYRKSNSFMSQFWVI